MAASQWDSSVEPARYRVVLISGWAQPSDAVQDLSDAISSWADVVIVELNHSEESLLEALNQAINVSCPVIVIGWSLGGTAAIRMLPHLKKVPEALVLIGSNPCFIGNECWPGVGSELFNEFSRMLEERPEKLLQRFSGLIMLGDPDARQLTRQARQWHEKVLSWPIEHLSQTLAWLKAWDMRDELADIKVPVLHLLGGLDRLVPTDELARLIREQYVDQVVEVVESMGHYPSQTACNELAMHIQRFTGE
ncbi:alpha/beta fold hydrolase [Hahella ganghwensis]|uniref:alpha/beta fold hydrolase n=1 Tax=Hahella ganghwensis TaxID=286420 RepID=UPI0003711B63|nr:alpha/beta fold hydrolase [Hahella ganghwensis]